MISEVFHWPASPRLLACASSLRRLCFYRLACSFSGQNELFSGGLFGTLLVLQAGFFNLHLICLGQYLGKREK